MQSVLPFVFLAMAFAGTAAGDDLEKRRTRLEKMSAEEKSALLRKKQRFDRLSTAEQQRMRQLHAAISEHQQGQQLQQVLARYNEWLKTLTANERAKLLGLPAEQRIEQIALLKQQQERRTFDLLGDRWEPPGDVEKLFQWASWFVLRHERELLASLPAADRERALRADAGQRQRVLLLAMTGLKGRRRPGQKVPLPNNEELQQLSEVLSPQARQVLENETEPGKKAVLVQRWLRAAVLAKRLPPVSDDQLQQFFDEELNDEEQEKLDQLSPDIRQRQLRRLYYMRYFRRVSQGGPPPAAMRNRSAGRPSSPAPAQPVVD